MTALRDKYKNQRENLKIEMSKEMDIINKRYNNVKRDISTKFKGKKRTLDKKSPNKKKQFFIA